MAVLGSILAKNALKVSWPAPWLSGSSRTGKLKGRGRACSNSFVIRWGRQSQHGHDSGGIMGFAISRFGPLPGAAV